MAARLTTYSVFNLLHRYAGLSLVTFILMYFLSGFIMTHHQWFKGPELETVEKRQNFRTPVNMGMDELAVFLQDSFDLRGYRQQPNLRSDSTVAFRFYHPGMLQEATLDLREDILLIKIRPQNFAQTITAFHRIHRYGGGGIYDLFVVMMDLTSFSMILFAVTGVYLWFKVIRAKILGWSILIASLLFTILVVGKLML